MTKVLTYPYSKEAIVELKAGDKVSICGIIYTARDQAHKKLIEEINNLPFDIENQILYYCGPTPPKPGQIIGSAGPTTSSRMDEFTSSLLEKGLLGTIGKGRRNNKVIEAIKTTKSVYFITIGGAGAFLSKKIKECSLIAYPELGTEAIYRLEVEDFPVYVGIDSYGNTIF
jgi:fumarate hydratase subunit beta